MRYDFIAVASAIATAIVLSNCITHHRFDKRLKALESLSHDPNVQVYQYDINPEIVVTTNMQIMTRIKGVRVK